MPFICVRRTDLGAPGAGVLQVKDLWPVKGQVDAAYGPKPQGPRYLRQPISDTVATTVVGGAIQTAAAYNGLAAYLIANIENESAGTPALTAAQANTIAAAVIASMRTGAAMTQAAFNTIVAATVAGSGIGLGHSTAVLTDILRILAGAYYQLPASYGVQTAGGAFVPMPTVAGVSQNQSYFNFSKWVDVITADSSFYISLAQGDIHGLYSSSVFSFNGSTTPAIVVYDNSGALM